VSFFSLANIDVFQATSLECLYETNFYSRLLIATILPISFGALVLCVYLFPKYYMINREAAQARQMPDHNQVIVEQTRLTQRKRVRRNGWKMVIFTLFLIYPLVSSTVLRIFVCKRVEDEDLLLADFKQRCHTAKWNNYAVYAAVMILVYPIGIPAFFFYMIRRYQRDGRLAEPGVVAELGFIYAAYDPAMWWFEMADMLHKLVLTSLLAFLPDSAQLPVGLWVVVLYTAAILLLKPYKHKGDDRLHLFVQTEILLMIYSGWLFFRGEDITDLIDAVLSVLLIGAVVFVFLFFLSQVLYAVYKLVKKWLADRERRRYEEWAKANPDEAARQEQLKQKRERARRRSRAAAAGGEQGETQGDMALARTKGRRSLNYGPLQRGESAAKMQRNPLAAYADLARSESASTSYVNPLFAGAPSGTLSEKRPSLLAMGGIGGPAGRGDGDEKDSDDEDAGAERGEFKEEALVSNPLFTRAASASAADDDDDFDDDGDGGRRRHESTLDEMMRQGSAANLANDPRVRQAKLREALGEELEFPAMSRGPSLRDDKEMRPSSGEGEK
jgi:Na+-transporting methylmalonyl-CoA/oxaloacetate decarboxylase gamma subunit